MKKTISAILAVMSLAVACSKSEDAPGETIRFSVVNLSGKDGMVETAAVGDFLLSAYPAGRTSAFCLNRTTVRSGDKNELPGYYWPLEGALDFYASFPPAQGQDISYDASCGEVCTGYSGLDGTQDYVAASAGGVSKRNSVNLEFHHLLSNFSQLQLTASHPDASVNVVSVKMSLPESGTYGYLSDAWLSRGKCSERVFSSPDGPCDYSLVPGTYTLVIEYTVSLYGTRRLFCKSADVTFRQGFRTRVSGVVENDMELSSLKVSIAPWTVGNTYSYSMQDVTPTCDIFQSEWTDADWGEVSFLKKGMGVITDADSFPGFRASCYAGGSLTPNYMYDEKFSSNGGNIYFSEHEFPCLPDDAQLTYYAYAPFDPGHIRLSARDYPGIPYLDYTVPGDIGSQEDLLTGFSDGSSIRFRHALSRISVYVDKNSKLEGTIFHLSVGGVASEGRIPLDGSAAEVFKPGIFSISSLSRTIVPGMQTPVLGEDEFFYMLPQTLSQDSSLCVGIRVNGADCYYECNIGGNVWKAGQMVCYMLDFTPKTLKCCRL